MTMRTKCKGSEEQSDVQPFRNNGTMNNTLILAQFFEDDLEQVFEVGLRKKRRRLKSVKTEESQKAHVAHFWPLVNQSRTEVKKSPYIDFF